jgi:serine/threonine-protein kinase
VIGRTLDERYIIVRLLGQGGMGAVYEARHVGTGRRVAVKIILGAGAQEQEQVTRFQREARAVGAVESDHIAQVFDTGRDRETGAPYIAMEFLEGEDVQELITRLGPLPVDLALRITLQACLGLQRAHQAGVIHRDIKPANLYLARKEGGARVVKLLDFGVAKTTSAPGDHALTKTGAMMGSPLYMSPEQARGAAAVDARTDLWSLGISLFQTMTGKRPNDHVTGLGELLITICSTPAPWIQTVAPWVPPEVARVVQKALSIDLAGRYADAGEMAQALQALLPYGHAIVDAMLVPLGATTRSYVAPQPVAAGAPMAGAPLAASGASLAAPGAPLATSSSVPATTLGTTGLDPRAATPARRSPLGLIAGGAVGLAVLGGGGLWWLLHSGVLVVAPSAGGSANAAASASPATSGSPAVTAASAAPVASSSAAPSAEPSAVASAPSVPAPATPRPAGTPGKRPQIPAAPIKKGNSDDETSRK